MELPELRREYLQMGLREADVAADPIAQFRVWFDQAVQAGIPDPDGMTLATATPDGFPSSRIVLLKGLSDAGFVFFTSYEGRKARDLAANPRAALCFYWSQLERQVRVEGVVELTSPVESDTYWATRPRGSQVSAWASHQSDVVARREVLESRLAELETKFTGRDVPRPVMWGGYRVKPGLVEFWQGRANRLHDRLRYRRLESGTWLIERLAP
ncbi:MAG: pyridoxamine 5'-phosphate oxidase [Gemmataceae bacterium]